MDPKIRNAVVIKTIPKNSIASQPVEYTYSGDNMCLKRTREYMPNIMNTKPNNAHNVTSKYRILGLLFNSLPPYIFQKNILIGLIFFSF